MYFWERFDTDTVSKCYMQITPNSAPPLLKNLLYFVAHLFINQKASFCFYFAKQYFDG